MIREIVEKSVLDHNQEQGGIDFIASIARPVFLKKAASQLAAPKAVLLNYPTARPTK